MQLSEEQLKAKKSIEKGENTFVTASAGYGKSTLLNNSDSKGGILCAPTGIAALNVKGSTLHKVFGLPTSSPTPADKYKIPVKMRRLFENDSVKRVNIDELGMTRPDYLDIIDTRLRTIKGNSKPFGGVQFVGFGDFYQIEPIVKYDERYFWDNYDSKFTFSAKSWNFNTIELTIPFRTTNPEQLSILSSLRTKQEGWESKFKELLDISKEYPQNSDVLHLCAYKADAYNINDYHYKQVKGAPYTYFSKNYGTEKFTDTEKPVPDVMNLKVGCKVLIKANAQDESYVNGDTGIVLKMDKDYVDVEVRGSVVRVEPFVWEKYGYSDRGEKIIVAKYKQIPLLLGYAISMHSCQGMTLDNAIIHVGKGCFSHGQFYMAVSRVRDLTNLGFIDKRLISTDNVIVNNAVVEYYRGLKCQMAV